MKKLKPRPPRKESEYFGEWVYRKYLLSRWLDLQGKKILSKEDASKVHGKAFQLILDTRTDISHLLYTLVVDRRCIVDCGSVCCYFPSKRGLGVCIEAMEAARITDTLRMMNLRKEDYIKTTQSKNKPITYLRLNKKREITKKALSKAPKLLLGGSIWVDGRSRACVFLGEDSSCMIYDRRPKACSGFICRTADMVNSLFAMGIVPPSYLDGKSISEVNLLAERCLRMFSDEKMRMLDARITVAFIDLVKSYLRSGVNLKGRIGELIRLSSLYDRRRNILLGIS